MTKQILIKVSDDEYNLIRSVCKELKLNYRQVLLNSLQYCITTTKQYSTEDKQMYADVRKDCHDLARLGNALLMKGYDVQIQQDIKDLVKQLRERFLDDYKIS